MTSSAPAGDRRPDGLLPGSHLRRPVLLRLESPEQVKHLMVTWLMALGTNLSAIWILVANGWMQNPTGAVFNRKPCAWKWSTSWRWCSTRWRRPVRAHRQCRLRDRCGVRDGDQRAVPAAQQARDLARRSFAVAAAFGLLSSLSVVVLGDDGYAASEHQKMKLAAIEAMWRPSVRRPTFFGIPTRTPRTTTR